MSPAHIRLIHLLASQAVKVHLTANTKQHRATPANDSNRAVPQKINSR